MYGSTPLISLRSSLSSRKREDNNCIPNFDQPAKESLSALRPEPLSLSLPRLNESTSVLSSAESIEASKDRKEEHERENEDSNMRRKKEKDHEFVVEGLTVSNKESSRTIVSSEVPRSLLLPPNNESFLSNDLLESLSMSASSSAPSSILSSELAPSSITLTSILSLNDWKNTAWKDMKNATIAISIETPSRTAVPAANKSFDQKKDNNWQTNRLIRRSLIIKSPPTLIHHHHQHS